MTIRVLSIDGGGMRGLYTAAYLNNLETLFRSRLKKSEPLDIGKAFDLITGTSTGAIIAAALACGIAPSEIATLYEQHGRAIFPKKVPQKIRHDLVWQLFRRSKYVADGEAALKKALGSTFRNVTFGDIYAERNIALCIPAIRMSDYKMWVFKTAHRRGTSGLDDGMSLVDACLASTAAPVYRSLACVDARGEKLMFADGGLAANNPILIGLIDALDMAAKSEVPEQAEIEIYTLGTCAPAEGTALMERDRHRGLLQWRFGGKAVDIALTAQTKATELIAGLLIDHLKANVKVIKFPQVPPPPDQQKLLQMDETSSEGMEVMRQLAAEPRNIIAQRLSNNKGDDMDIARIEALFASMPPLKPMQLTGGVNG